MYISKEDKLPQYYQDELPQFISKKLIVGYWQRSDSATLHYRYVVNTEAKAWLVIMQGRAESVVKYAELIDELYRNGFSVFAFDHIGQGQSGRKTANPLHGFVSNFDEYVEDATHLIEEVMFGLKESHAQASLSQYLLCHSMGSAIGTLLLAKAPQLFDKAVLCAPMYGIKAPFPAVIAKYLVTLGASIHRLLGIESGYFLGQSDYKSVAFSENKLTSSRLRYEWFKQYYHDNVDAQLGGVTFQWLAAALQAMDKIHNEAQNIHLPILMLQAGDDQIVDNKAITRTFAQLPNAELMPIAGAKHEILFEQDCYRVPALTSILAFLLA